MSVKVMKDGVELNKSQADALEVLIYRLAHDDRQTVGTGHEVEFTFELKPTDYGVVWVRVFKDIPGLPKNNILRALERMDTWLVEIGKRGKLTAHITPKSLHQFKGSAWCGIHIRGDAS